jgi:hypothetical protein
MPQTLFELVMREIIETEVDGIKLKNKMSFEEQEELKSRIIDLFGLEITRRVIEKSASI